MVGAAHKGVQRVRHGVPPEEQGGTNLDNANGQAGKWGTIAKLFGEEVRNQFNDLRPGGGKRR